MGNASSEEQYDSDQQKLREQSGLDEGGDLELPDLQVPQVNPEIYKDVEPLLFRGFLAVPATINDVTFVFKSLSHHEVEWLTLTQSFTSNRAAQRYHDMFLALGVALVDGVNIIKQRDEQLPRIADFFGSLPKPGYQKVIRHLSEINRRASRAVILVESYFMENQSRLRWLQVKGLDLSTVAVTGFEGTQTLGLNWGQLTWRALNQLEDTKENAEREWENAKFIASAMAGKGMQRVYNTDKRRRQDAKAEQIERREKLIRYALFNEPIDDQEKRGDVVVARTVGELTDQLERDLKGEKDWHDRVIEEHENRVRSDVAQRAQSIEEARAAHVEQFGSRPVLATTSLQGLTRTQVQERLNERHTAVLESLAARDRHPELTDPKYSEFSDKWLRQPIVGDAPSVMPVESQRRPRTTPFRKGF